MTNPYPFERSTCACRECVQCCKKRPGPLAPGDFERIAAYLGEDPETAKRHFCSRWPGGVLKSSHTGEVVRVGTLNPKKRQGRCVFLDQHDRCTIHAVAPAGCALFDMHQSKMTSDERALWLVNEELRDKNYQALVDELPREP